MLPLSLSAWKLASCNLDEYITNSIYCRQRDEGSVLDFVQAKDFGMDVGIYDEKDVSNFTPSYMLHHLHISFQMQIVFSMHTMHTGLINLSDLILSNCDS